MEEKKWCKIPQNLIYSPRIHFVVNKLPKEKQHTAFTFLTSLYCNADDEGIVDMSDFEIYANEIYLTPEELRTLVDSFINAGILLAFIIGLDVFKIIDWEKPKYETNTKESWKERMAKISQWTTTPPENYSSLIEYKNQNSSQDTEDEFLLSMLSEIERITKTTGKAFFVEDLIDAFETTEHYTIPFILRN